MKIFLYLICLFALIKHSLFIKIEKIQIEPKRNLLEIIGNSIKRKNKDSEGEEKENIVSSNNNTDNSTHINEDSIEAEKDLPYSEQDEFIPDHMTLEERKRFQFLRYESVRANCFVHYEGYFYDLNKIQFEKGKK